MNHPRRTLALVPALGLALVALLASARPAQDAKEQLRAIDQELQQQFARVQAASRAGDGSIGAVLGEFRDKTLPGFAKRLAEIAHAHPGTDDALDAWMKVFDLVPMGYDGAIAHEALEVVTRDHLSSERLVDLANLLEYAPEGDEEAALHALRTMAEGSPHRAVKAAALFSLGCVLASERDDGDPRLEEAKVALRKLADYADLKHPDGRSYTDAAHAILFALENLVVGKPCPEFDALDAEGAGFKLSDYRGKVVLIDFWGFW